MAKSKNGGTRSFIRGRIGSDVYSVGKDGKGARQQVVRSLAEQVANPRSSAQMFGRMVMSTVMQAVSALKPIIDHSFDGMATGQPSISEFIRRNYALVKADAEAHPNGGNTFGLNKYQEKGVKGGLYIVSNGSVQLPAAVRIATNFMTIDLTESTMTVGGLKAALGLSADGYLTAIVVGDTSGASFARVRLTTSLADSTAITAENVASLFTIEGNVGVTVTVYQNSVSFELAHEGGSVASGVIVSEKIAGAWQHNQCILSGDTDYEFNSSAALPTYPTGAQMFLNGGDL
jgi:hypothetical protein